MWKRSSCFMKNMVALTSNRNNFVMMCIRHVRATIVYGEETWVVSKEKSVLQRAERAYDEYDVWG